MASTYFLSSAVSLGRVHLLSTAAFTIVCLRWSVLFDFSISLVLEDEAGLATISAVMLFDSVLFPFVSCEELVLMPDETVFNSFSRGPFRTVTLADILLLPCFMASWVSLC